MDVPYDERKFTEMVVYVARRLEGDRAGGATKLNKALFFADFAHMRRFGRPISGAEYQRLPNGPAPRRLLPVRQSLVRKGHASVASESFLGYEQHRLVAHREADTTVFTNDELAIIDRVLDDLAHLTGRQVSDLSHEEPGWQLSEPGATIAYETALIARRQTSTPTSRRLAADAARLYGITVDA